jgi:glutaryl-CoA dehydrogenase
MSNNEDLDFSTDYKGLDFFNLDSQFTEEEKMYRDSTREWVEDRFLSLDPHTGVSVIESHCRTGTFPIELAREFGEMGLLGVNLHGYECPGQSNVAYGLACQELERGDSGLRSFASVQGSLCMYPIWDFGTEEQKKKYLPKMATGELIGCFGLTEPDHGSNPGGMVTKAIDDGDSYILNGAKMWITNGTIADLAIVWAKLGGNKSKHIRGFIVEKGDIGFSAPEMKGKHSLRASVTSELVFQDCRIPKDRLLPNVAGLRGPFSCLNNARFGISWGALGAAMACYHSARTYSLSRT